MVNILHIESLSDFKLVFQLKECIPFFLCVFQGQLPNGHAKFHVLFLLFVAVMFFVSLMFLFGYHCWLVAKNRSTLGRMALLSSWHCFIYLPAVLFHTLFVFQRRSLHPCSRMVPTGTALTLVYARTSRRSLGKTRSCGFSQSSPGLHHHIL